MQPLTILGAVEHSNNRHLIVIGVYCVNYYVRQSGNLPLICARNSANMPHVREVAKPFGAFKNPIDY